MSVKRTQAEAFEEFGNVSSVTHTSPNAKIHCVVSKIPSKMKTGKNSPFFDRRLSDGTKTIWVHGYDPDARRRLFETQEQAERTVLLSGCSIKPERNGQELEVFVNKQTTIEKSCKSFAVPKEEPQGKVSISSAAAMDNNSKVTVEVKIISKQEAGFIESKQLPIQDLKVADSSGSICLTVWADIVDKLKVDQSYQLQNVSVREYKGKKFLSTSIITEVTPINDIGTVDIPTNDYESNPEDPAKHLKNVRVVGVLKLDPYHQCFKCSSKVQQDDDELGKCTRCHIFQNISDCSMGIMACVIIKATDGTTLTLRVFDRVVHAIAEKSDEITPRDLLRAQPFGIHFEDGIIRSIRRS